MPVPPPGGLPEKAFRIIEPFLEPEPKTKSGDGGWLVSGDGIGALASGLEIPHIKAMILCLEHGVWPTRFARNRGAFSAEGQAKLLDSRLAVIGTGGLGGFAVNLLARAGVGGLTICDHDVFEESNLNRQIAGSVARLGRLKVLCAKKDALAVNPFLSCRAVTEEAGPANLADILSGCRAALDCLDNHQSRYDLEAAAAKEGIPYVHGALAGWEGFVMLVRPGDAGLRGLYGKKPVAKAESAEILAGTPTTTPALVAVMQVQQVLNFLLERPCLKSGELLHLDLEACSTEVLRIG